MALILIDGFDKYAQATDPNLDGWSGAGSGNNSAVAPGRFGLPGRGYAVGQYGNLTRYLPANLATFYLGVAINGTFQLGFNDTNNNQFWVYAVNSTVQVGRSGYANNLLGQSLAGVVPSSGWFFLEIGATVSTTAGQVTVRINGNVVLSLTGQNLQSTVNAYINNIAFYGAMLIDDLYLCDATTGPGTYPCNTFLGDKRVRTVYPSANVSTAFTTSGSVTAGQSAQGNGGNWQSVSANTLILTLPDNASANLPGTGPGAMDDPNTGVAPRMARDATLTAMKLYAQTNYPAMKIRPVIASVNPVNGMPLAILYAGDEKIGLASGQNTLTFSSVTATVTKDTPYALGFVTDTSFSLDSFGVYPYSNPLTATYPMTYVSPPTALGALPAGPAIGNNKLNIGYNYTAVNYAAVSEDGFDGDVAFNSSATVGATDLFGTSAGLPSGAMVYGVRLVGAYRKDDAGTRQVANLIKSGTTQTAGATQNLGTSYQYLSDVFAINPATGASWAVTDVNALEIGYQVIS